MLRNNGRSAVSNSITYRTGAGCSKYDKMSWSSDYGSIIHDRRTCGRWAVWEQAGGRARSESLADNGGGAGRWLSVLRVMVLAAARLPWFPRGNRKCVALAMAGGGSVGVWIRRSPAKLTSASLDEALSRNWFNQDGPVPK